MKRGRSGIYVTRRSILIYLLVNTFSDLDRKIIDYEITFRLFVAISVLRQVGQCTTETTTEGRVDRRIHVANADAADDRRFDPGTPAQYAV